MSHTDVYGRTWHWEPGHDTSRMLQIKEGVMLEFLMFYYKTRMPRLKSHQFEAGFGQVVDCYLLKGGSSEWYAGIRFSDEPSHYYSPDIDPDLTRYMISVHKYSLDSQAESEAMFRICREMV